MPATEGPLPPPTPRDSGQRTKPVFTTSTHPNTWRPRPAPASPSAPPRVSSVGRAGASRCTVLPTQASVQSSLGTLPSTPLAKHRATAPSPTAARPPRCAPPGSLPWARWHRGSGSSTPRARSRGAPPTAGRHGPSSASPSTTPSAGPASAWWSGSILHLAGGMDRWMNG